MKTIILGKDKPATLDSSKGEVYQPFTYKTQQTGVSRKHATITIDDNGYWWLEDRWSTNGTYIREEDGNFRKIGDKEHPGKCRITPMTFVKLGIDDPTGCCFYARQAENFGNYDEEFEFLENKLQELSENEAKSKKEIKMISNLLEFGLPVVLMIVFILFIKPYAVNAGGVATTIIGGLGFGFIMLLSRMAKSFYGPQEKKKQIEKVTKDTKKSFSNCPNPLCNHVLSENEIEVMKCNFCNIQHN